MARTQTEGHLAVDWLLPPEKELLHKRRGATRLGFALPLKFFQLEGRCLASAGEIPPKAVEQLAQQTSVAPELWKDYPCEGRMSCAP